MTPPPSSHMLMCVPCALPRRRLATRSPPPPPHTHTHTHRHNIACYAACSAENLVACSWALRFVLGTHHLLLGAQHIVHW